MSLSHVNDVVLVAMLCSSLCRTDNMFQIFKLGGGLFIVYLMLTFFYKLSKISLIKNGWEILSENRMWSFVFIWRHPERRIRSSWTGFLWPIEDISYSVDSFKDNMFAFVLGTYYFLTSAVILQPERSKLRSWTSFLWRTKQILWIQPVVTGKVGSQHHFHPKTSKVKHFAILVYHGFVVYHDFGDCIVHHSH